MQIKNYLNEVLSIIAKNPYIKAQNISLEERPPNAAYLSGLLIFIDGSNPEHKHISKKVLPAPKPSLEEILKEVSESFQNSFDLKTMADRIYEPVESYAVYRRKRKSKKR